MKNKGYTIVEVFIAIAIISILILMGFGIWAAVHFISKYW